MKTRKTRFLSVVLALVMVALLLPQLIMPAIAVDSINVSVSHVEKHRINVSNQVSVTNITNYITEQTKKENSALSTLGKINKAAGTFGKVVNIGMAMAGVIDEDAEWYENVANVAIAGVCAYLGIPFGDTDNNEEVLNAIQELQTHIDNRFDIIESELDALSAQQKEYFVALNETIKETSDYQYYQTLLTQFGTYSNAKFGSYNSYYEWQDVLFYKYEELIAALADENINQETVQRCYDELYACALETHTLQGFMTQTAYDNGKVVSIQDIYYQYYMLGAMNGSMDGVTSEDAVKRSIEFVNDLYSTYRFSQFCLGLCYTYQYANILENTGVVDGNSSYKFSDGFSIIKNNTTVTGVRYQTEIKPFIDAPTKDMEAMESVVAKFLAYVLAFDNFYIYHSAAISGETYSAVDYKKIYDEDQYNAVKITEIISDLEGDTDHIVISNKVACGDTLYLHAMPDTFRGMFDYQNFSFVVSDDDLATVTNGGIVTVTGEEGLFSVELQYDGQTVYTMSFVIAERQFSGGMGTETHPYLISTADDLRVLSENYDDYLKKGCHFRLTNDIDLGGSAFTPIQKFTGVFDGANHKIHNFTVTTVFFNTASSAYEAGLFSYVQDGTVKNLQIGSEGSTTEVKVSSSDNNVHAGMIAGYSANGSIVGCRVVNCQVVAESTNSNGWVNAAGVCGVARWGSISMCSVTQSSIVGTGEVKECRAGGIVGFSDSVLISDCYVFDNADGGIDSSNKRFSFSLDYACAGGIAAQAVKNQENHAMTIQRCVVKGTYVSASAHFSTLAFFNPTVGAQTDTGTSNLIGTNTNVTEKSGNFTNYQSIAVATYDELIAADAAFADYSCWRKGETGEIVLSSCVYESQTIVKEPTHLSEGLVKHTCKTETSCAGSVCILDRLEDHIFSEWCNADAEQHKRFCECGATEYATHDWALVQTVQPTYYAAGEYVYLCAVCNHSYSVEIPQLEITEETPQIVLDAETGLIGGRFTITVSLQNNPGLWSAAFELPINVSKFEFVSADYAGSIFGASGTCGYDETTGTYKFNRYHSDNFSNMTEDGLLVTLTLRIKDGVAAGDHLLTVTPEKNNCIDVDKKQYDLYGASSLVTVVECVLGDANGDGGITNADALSIFRYIYSAELYPLDVPAAADVNGDGTVSNADVLAIFRYIYNAELYPLG